MSDKSADESQHKQPKGCRRWERVKEWKRWDAVGTLLTSSSAIFSILAGAAIGSSKSSFVGKAVLLLLAAGTIACGIYFTNRAADRKDEQLDTKLTEITEQLRSSGPGAGEASAATPKVVAASGGESRIVLAVLASLCAGFAAGVLHSPNGPRSRRERR